MKSKFKLVAGMACLTLAFIGLTPSLALAQEGEMQVVDEVIAQINDDIITLSMLRRETKERIESLKQNGMTEQQAKDEVNKRQAELIATLVNEQLLMQKGKELELTEKVEAEVNKRMLEVANEQGIKSMEKLCEAMKQQGMLCEDVRKTLRVEIMKQAVIQGEVDAKYFWSLSLDEVKKYFEAHKDKFKKPEVVTLSEIFLGLAGNNEAQVKAKADQLVAQLRGGANFATVAAANSERQDQTGERTAPKNQGKVGTFEVPNLREDLAAALNPVKAGGVTDPIKSAEGYQILRVDERTAASDASVFNENQVREAMTIEASPKNREQYLQELRDEAYIKIAESYYAAVAPILKLKPEKTVEASGSATNFADRKKSKGKFLKIFPKP